MTSQQTINEVRKIAYDNWLTNSLGKKKKDEIVDLCVEEFDREVTRYPGTEPFWFLLQTNVLRKVDFAGFFPVFIFEAIAGVLIQLIMEYLWNNYISEERQQRFRSWEQKKARAAKRKKG